MKSYVWTGEVVEDSNGDPLILMPEEMINELGWTYGDELIWEQLDDGNWSLRKYEDSDSQ